MSSMNSVPDAMRLQITLTGRTNSGKSSLFNLIAGQEAAITSPLAGTTTDVVSKAMELRPVGAVLLLDSAGLGDDTVLGAVRMKKAVSAIDRADVLLLVLRSGVWGAEEDEAVRMAQERRTALIPVVNLFPGEKPDAAFNRAVAEKCRAEVLVSRSLSDRDGFLAELKVRLLEVLPDDFINPPPLLGDLAGSGDVVVLVVPIDSQAPKGRLILPQVQTLRDGLDHNIVMLTVRDSGFERSLHSLRELPKLVVCDSQKIDMVSRITPESVACTTFSVLFSRLKGDFSTLYEGAQAIGALKEGDRVLIAEGCTHHAAEEDIGRVKIPRLLEKKLGVKLNFEFSAGRDYPDDLDKFKLVVHCGGCMLNRRETLRRIALAHNAGVPVTNYGMAISYCQGVLDRVVKPLIAKKEESC